MRHPIALFLFALPVLGALLFWLVRAGDQPPERGRLLVYCAAGFREPMRELADRYEEKYGTKILLQFGGSGALASQLQVAGGDLYFPADESYLETIALKEALPVVRLTAGLVVQEGNPKGLGSLRDLGREGIRISLAEESASIGKLTWQALEDEGVLEMVQPNVVVTKPTVTGIVSDVATGAVDAALAWDAVSSGFAGVEWISLPEFSKRAKRASIGVLEESGNAEGALHFARYVVSGKSREVFEEMGYELVNMR